jgi:hypothetical protein
MVSLEKAKKFAQGLRLKSWSEWRRYVDGDIPGLPPKPKNIPAVPHACYRTEGWISYADFLGTSNVAWHNVKWRPFKDARTFARGLGLSNPIQWRAWIKTSAKPNDIPSNPEKVYSNWKGYRDFLQG